MKGNVIRAASVMVGAMVFAGGQVLAGETAANDHARPKDANEQAQFLPGSRAVLGTVQTITGDQIKVDIGEVQPRFLPAKPTREKQQGGVKPGDTLIVVLNDQNLIVDYHPADHPIDQHRILRGKIAQNLSIGHDRVIIETQAGAQEDHGIMSQARSKVASIPVGVDALFLLDESSQVADATFASGAAVKEAQQSVEDKSPLKGAQRRIDGTVVQALKEDHITIRTSKGEERFQIRPTVQEKIGRLNRGEEVVLLVDPSDQVFDVAIPPQAERAK